MQDSDSLLAQFGEDVDRIANSLIGSFGLKHGGGVAQLSTPLLRWFDFRMRVIDPRPREVLFSDRFPKPLDVRTRGALQGVEAAFRGGEDVNIYQSKTLLNYDTSGNARQSRTDLLWADWGIHHLHLSEVDRESSGYFAPRADFLLFVMVRRHEVLFVDVLPHSLGPAAFVNEDLIKVVARNWPPVVEPFELKSAMPSRQPYTEEERRILRRSGIDAPLVIDGKMYFAPGQGITSASTAGKVSMAIVELRRNLRTLVELVLDPAGQFLQRIPEALRHRSHFSLALMPLGVGIIERETNCGWAFPDHKFDGTHDVFGEISDSFTPPWIKRAMQAAGM